MLLYLFIYKSNIENLKFNINFDTLWEDFKYFLFIIIGLYGEYFAVESNAYFTAVSGRIEYVTSW